MASVGPLCLDARPGRFWPVDVAQIRTRDIGLLDDSQQTPMLVTIDHWQGGDVVLDELFKGMVE